MQVEFGVEAVPSMREPLKSGCPINLTLEVLGDRWSLIVIRDIMFGNRRHFGDLLHSSVERIASNILADRLARLVGAGLLSRNEDPSHKQKALYSLTESSIELVPLLAHLGAWGRRHTPASRELSIPAQLLEEGGPRMWNAFMAELRHLHLGAPTPRRSVFTELQTAYLAIAGEPSQAHKIQSKRHKKSKKKPPNRPPQFATLVRRFKETNP